MNGLLLFGTALIFILVLVRLWEVRDEMEQALKYLPLCRDCDDEGWYDIDMGGGKTRKAFCDCEKGQKLKERAENSRTAHIDAKVDEYMERRRSR